MLACCLELRLGLSCSPFERSYTPPFEGPSCFFAALRPLSSCRPSPVEGYQLTFCLSALRYWPLCLPFGNTSSMPKTRIYSFPHHYRFVQLWGDRSESAAE